jgi:hypothetical protein
MIRFLLLTIIPLIVPFIAWYVWKVFADKPKIDPQSGEQIPPDIERAPRAKLLLVGALLMIVTVAGFLAIHDKTADNPYKPPDAADFEKILEREQPGDDKTKPQ